MDAVVFDACMTAAYSPRPGTPMAHWDGASVAFETLGVELRRLKSVEEAREEVLARFKLLAQQKARQNQHDDDAAWDSVVIAKREALEALDRAEKAPPSAFHPLSGVGPAQCPDEVKEERLQRINEKADAHALQRSERYVGRIEPVLVESRNTRVPTLVVGRTRATSSSSSRATRRNWLGGRSTCALLKRAFSLVAGRGEGCRVSCLIPGRPPVNSGYLSRETDKRSILGRAALA